MQNVTAALFGPIYSCQHRGKGEPDEFMLVIPLAGIAVFLPDGRAAAASRPAALRLYYGSAIDILPVYNNPWIFKQIPVASSRSVLLSASRSNAAT